MRVLFERNYRRFWNGCEIGIPFVHKFFCKQICYIEANNSFAFDNKRKGEEEKKCPELIRNTML